MIKHLGEGLTPFETHGFSRAPEMPLTGEKVLVVCRVDVGDDVPSLTLSTSSQMKTLAGEPLGDRRYRFDLGVFEQSQKVNYRFFTVTQETAWFSFDVLTVQELSTPTALYQKGDAITASFDQEFTVTFLGGETLEIITEQGGAEGSICDRATLVLPEGFSCDISISEKIWELKRFSNTIWEGRGFTLFRRADHSIAKIQTRMSMACTYVMGTGERFDAVNQKHRSTNGRVVEKFTHQGDQTYLPVPFFFTEQGFGWYRVSDIPAEMHFDDLMTISQETEGSLLTRDILFFGSPASTVSAYLACTGKPVLPPEWAFGVWISANGWCNDAEVNAQLSALERYNYPATVLVLEAWSDERTFYRWNSDGSWKDPADTICRLREHGLHLVLWQIPIIKHEWNGKPGDVLEADIRDVVDMGYAVKSADGSPYRITENWFHHSMMLDFTNPDAVRWWFGKRKYLLDMGVEGFKTDGGEFLFEKTARLYDGSTGLKSHNLYPGQYIGAYHDFLRQNGVNGVIFSRAGYVGAQTQPIHWAGDQLSEWCELQSQLRAGITAGLSGVLFWGFDIGGFAGELPSVELYLRATAMGCFSPIMQWHTEPRNGQFHGTYSRDYNNDRSPWNLAEKLGDSRALEIACEYARLRERLRPYLWEEAQHCILSLRPMMAHLCLDFPEDTRAWEADGEYMLGRRYLVAPVVQEGESERMVYLPRGRWRHFFTGECFDGNNEIRVLSPLEEIPVFERIDDCGEGPY